MKRLLISTTCFSMVLTSGPIPLAAQTVLKIGDQEVICLPNNQTECPEGAFCVVAKREKNCEANAIKALGLAAEGEVATEPATPDVAVEGDAAVTDDGAAVDADTQAQAEADAKAAEAEAAAQAEAKAAADAEKAAAVQAEADAAAQADAAAAADAEKAAAADAEKAAAAQAEVEAAAAAEAAQAEADAAQAKADKAAAQAQKDAEKAAAAADADATDSAQAEARAAAKAAQAEADAAAAQADADATDAAAAQADAEAAATSAAQADADAAAAAQAEADAAAADEGEVKPEPKPEVVVAPMTEAEAAVVLETSEGIEAPKAEAVDALTDILAADPAGIDGQETAISQAAAAAAEEGPDLTNPEQPVATGDTGEAAQPAEPPVKRRKPRAVVTAVTEEDTRTSDQDFEGEAIASETARNGDGKKRLSDLEKFGLVVVGALIVGAILKNGDKVVSNTGDRVVVQQPDGQYVVLKDDDTLIRRPGSTVQTETYDDGSTRSTVLYTDGSRIVTIRDAAGRVLRRARIDAEGRQTLLIDDLAPVERIDVSTLPKPRLEGRVIRADDQDAELRAALLAEEGRDLGRSFSLRQVREYAEVRALAPTIDVAAITFETGSAAIRGSEARKLKKLGELMADMVRENPSEVFLIEGHTDAVGSGAYNLALSDRRAESLALALTEYYAVPPENMVVQGYGERELLIDTAGDEPRNRRTAVRVISPLLDRTASR